MVFSVTERFINNLLLFMCMNIGKEDLLRINEGFGGNLRSDSSLDYAIDMQSNNKLGEYKKLAYLLRAILVDHPFSDGNKRTATFIVLNFAEQNKKQVDRELLIQQIISIAKQNINNIRNIEQRLRSCIV
jgi:prophage maintenance system killer protein